MGPPPNHLPPPARYFPLESGRYEVRPGLSRFGRDQGGGAVDSKVFQIDSQFEHYRAQKLASRAERLSKYYQTHRLTPETRSRITRFIIDRLAREHPGLFQLDGQTLHCTLTGDSLRFNDQCEIASDRYIDAFDALACQVQEDLAVMRVEGNDHWLSAVHLCFPNHWAAEEKIGRTFAAIHEPVAEMDKMNAQQTELLRIMIEAKDGLVRFAWGLATDNYLNHHPQPPPGAPPGRQFKPNAPEAYLRVERQTLWGFHDLGASLFTIRTYFVDVQTIKTNPIEANRLISAVESMSPASLAYKGLVPWKEPLLNWLRG